MPTLDENRNMWNDTYDWNQAGEEWSSEWRGPETQWYNGILPRIYRFLPSNTILEIAPGFGRWTQFLKDECKQLIVVDLSEKCINACKERFRDCTQINYYVNDGKSLEFIPDGSVQFVYSFDSLVHAEEDVIQAYLGELPRILSESGVAFIHHSNLGEFAGYLSFLSRIPYRVKHALARLGLIETLEPQWRAQSVSAALFAQWAEHFGLQCISQELVSWESRRLIDCISIVTRKGSIWARPNKVVRNKGFAREARYAATLAAIYGGSVYNQKTSNRS